jgi:hypothetical protein
MKNCPQSPLINPFAKHLTAAQALSTLLKLTDIGVGDESDKLMLRTMTVSSGEKSESIAADANENVESEPNGWY